MLQIYTFSNDFLMFHRIFHLSVSTFLRAALVTIESISGEIHPFLDRFRPNLYIFLKLVYHTLTAASAHRGDGFAVRLVREVE